MTLGSGTIFLGGLLTFASPCVLPLIPIYLSVLLGGSVEEMSGSKNRFKLFFNGTMFVIGFMMVFVLMGLSASFAGKYMVQHRLLFQQLGGMLVFFFGLKFLGLVKWDLLNADKRFRFGLGSQKGISPLGAVAIGFTFAFGWTPCVGPILGSILTFTAVSTHSMAMGAWYLFLYSLGIAIPLLLVALFAQTGTTLLRKVARFLPRLEKATGVLLVLLSILMVTDKVAVLAFDGDESSSARISKDIVVETMGDHKGETVARAKPQILGADPRLPPRENPEKLGDGPAQCTSAESCGLDESEELGFEMDLSVIDELTAGPVALYFHKPDCPACLKMVPIMAAVYETCGARGLKVTKIDISISENKALAREMGVRGTPTLAFFDENRNEVSRLVGYQDLDDLHDAVVVLMGQVCADFTRI